MNTGAGIHRPVVRVGAHRRGAAAADVVYSPLTSAGSPLPLPRRPHVGATHGEFAVFARESWPRLVATALLLTEDPVAAEELARLTLVRVCARWRRIPRNDVDFHVRRCLVRAYLRAPLRPPGRAPLRGRRPGPFRRAGGRRRVVLVLRYGEGLGQAEIAQVLGVSVGAVRAWVRREAKRVRPEDRSAGFAAALAGFVPDR
ncbi:sigma factor-like helix-turn-helix DNA-binding protein, partial [Streptomyces sp. G35A]